MPIHPFARLSSRWSKKVVFQITSPLCAIMQSNIAQISLYLLALANRFTGEEVAWFVQSSVRPAFFYGPLMLPAIIVETMEEVDAIAYATNMTLATLSQHQRLGIKSKPYPALLSSDNERDLVCGMLLFGLSPQQQRKLDEYEWRYDRTQVTVNLELQGGDNRAVNADVYICRIGLEDLCIAEEMAWTIERYCDSRKQ